MTYKNEQEKMGSIDAIVNSLIEIKFGVTVEHIYDLIATEKTGYWVEHFEGNYPVYCSCSECNFPVDVNQNNEFIKYKICPDCGAHMIGGEKDI